jgi:hypothetical protein
VKLVDFRIEEFSRGGGRCDPATNEQLRHNLGNVA